MHEVDIDPLPLDRLEELLRGERGRQLHENARMARDLFAGRVVWNISATATGGGVAEMLTALLSYCRGAGVDARWLVLDGTPEFFRLTKRIHNLLHGSDGDGGRLDDDDRAAYEEALQRNIEALTDRISADDFVLLHDPQTAGLVPQLLGTGARVLWRSHIGRDTTNEHTDRGWRFLRPYVEKAHATVFSRQEYVPDWVDHDRVAIIPPSLDPFSAKNAELDPEDVRATLGRAGLVDLPDHGGELEFQRHDGSTGRLRRHDDVFAAGGVVPGDARLVMQVSRWDRLKDMGGVLQAFADHLDSMPDEVHLALVGPDVSGVTDDPEGAEVLEQCTQQWRALPATAQERIHLATLPMDDVEENAHLVNALQRHAELVVQKSLVEGFGLTVTEPMWKGRPVVASRVGGIRDQIVEGVSGLLVEPEDLDGFAEACRAVLVDPELAARLGSGARERVRERFLGDRQLTQYLELLGGLA